MDNNELLKRVEMLSDEIHRIKCMLESHTEWPDMDPFMEDEVYMELASEKKQARSEIIVMMEHLLKLKYCTNNWNHKTWSNEVYNHRYNFLIQTGYGSKKPSTVVINDTRNSLDDLINKAIMLYKHDSMRYSDLEDGLLYNPDKCPWTLEELMELPIHELLDRLPEPHGALTVQMQLYPMCKMIGDNGDIVDKMKGQLCITCHFYEYCMRYYNSRK